MNRRLWQTSRKTLSRLSFFLLAVASVAVAAEKAESATPGGDEGIARQVMIDGVWQEAEAFVVLPEKTVELRVEISGTTTAVSLAGLAAAAPKEGTRSFQLETSTEYRWAVDAGRAGQMLENRLEWAAPSEPGHYKIECQIKKSRVLTYSVGGEGEKRRESTPLTAATTFHILVPYPYNPEGSGVIEGYPIGVYPREDAGDIKAIVAAHRDRYQPPKWFVAVTPETRDLRVSANFRLREFVPDASPDARAFFPYNANLVRALEATRDALEKSKVKAPRLRILRGFVAPYEAERMRRQGARLITWNRYQYGDAVLFIVDRNRDEVMDDINGDGKADEKDAREVARIVRGVQQNLRLPGWIGAFSKRADKTLPETPMVGFDLRGWWVGTAESESSPDAE